MLHADSILQEEIDEGLSGIELRALIIWVNLARADKKVAPSFRVLRTDDIPARREGGATIRVLVGEGSPARLGTPSQILDVELPEGGEVTTPVPHDYQGVAYVLYGEATFGANRRPARAKQLVLLGQGGEVTVRDASPGTRYLLMAGKPYGDTPVFNGPFVD